MSNSLWAHVLQHTRLPCPSPIPRACSNSKSIESVMPFNHLILCHPLLPTSIFPRIRVFSTESVLWISCPKYWIFCFSISPSNKYSGLISFRTDWFDLCAIQGTLKSLLQHHSAKASTEIKILKEVKCPWTCYNWILINWPFKIMNYKALVHFPKVEMSTQTSFHL